MYEVQSSSNDKKTPYINNYLRWGEEYKVNRKKQLESFGNA